MTEISDKVTNSVGFVWKTGQEPATSVVRQGASFKVLQTPQACGIIAQVRMPEEDSRSYRCSLGIPY